MFGSELEEPHIGKTTLKDGRETTYKRGYTPKEYLGGFKNGHPAAFSKNNEKFRQA